MSMQESGMHRTAPGRLTKIYSDTKKSYDFTTSPSVTMDGDPQLRSLHRSLRTQKDRLMNWGLDWSDKNAQQGDIDQPLERAGLTSLVESLMTSIKEILDEAENMSRKNNGLPGYRGWEKSSHQGLHHSLWTAADKTRLHDLVKDLTTSIDTLYDLSGSLRGVMSPVEKGTQHKESLRREYLLTNDYPSPALSGIASELGEKAKYPEFSPVQERVLAKIDPSALIFSDHSPWASSRPPPYEAIMTQSNERTLAYLRDPSSISERWMVETYGVPVVPVMIEYAVFDPIYSQTGIAPPLDRLHSLASVLHHCVQPGNYHTNGVLRLVGYFEASSSCYGLIYELPRYVSLLQNAFELSLAAIMPISLLSMLQANITSSSSQFPDLEVRLRLAYGLTSTLFELHSRGFLHRGMNSNNILLFPQDKSASGTFVRYPPIAENKNADLRKPYLSSFDIFSEDGVDASQEYRSLDIYRHPLEPRHDSTRKQRYFPSFDIYSLGLILLEIGLWMPLSSFWKHKYTPGMFKSRIETIYVKKLAAKCGSCYMRAVQQCLAIGGSEQVKPKAYSVILERLQRCCMIDEHDPPPQISPMLETQLSRNSPAISSSFSPLSLFSMPVAGFPELALPASRSSPSLGQKQKEKESQFTVPRKSLSADSRIFDSKPAQSPITASPKLQLEPLESPPKKRKIKVYPARVTPELLSDWHENLLPRLERILEKTVKDPCETVSMDLVSAGESKETAKPTIVVTCSSVVKVKAVLSRRLKYDKSKYELRVRKGKVRRSKAPGGRRNGPQKSLVSDPEERDASPANPFHQTRPLCGASIGAFTFNGNGSGAGSHSGAGSYGGVVLIDGEPFGMTVHHLLDEPSDFDDSDAESKTRLDSASSGKARPSMASRGAEDRRWQPIQTAPEQGIEDDEEYAYEMTDDEGYNDSADESHSEHTGEEFDDVEEYSEDESDEESDDSFGDTAGIKPGDGEGLIITQPAYQDVDEGFFLSSSDKDGKHLNEHSLGYVHASSGSRRLKQGGIHHEIDWALLKLHEERLQPFNLVQGGKRYARKGGCQSRPTLRDPVCRNNYHPEEDLYPVEVAGMNDLGGKEVHCFGRTSGLQQGVINPAMSALKLNGRLTFSHSFHVWGNFGMGGDSGAWVIDNERGSVCGHVLAWSSNFFTTYICPMQLLVQDIARTVNATTISLPLGEHIAPATESCIMAGFAGPRAHPQHRSVPLDMFAPAGIYAPEVPWDLNETEDEGEGAYEGRGRSEVGYYDDANKENTRTGDYGGDYASQLTDDVMDMFKARLRRKITISDSLEGLRIRSSPSPEPEPDMPSRSSTGAASLMKPPTRLPPFPPSPTGATGARSRAPSAPSAPGCSRKAPLPTTTAPAAVHPRPHAHAQRLSSQLAQG
ncbi:hypothetical protein L228DRAFT_239646 [Xylona heveae TC161]|uniref:Protein kinase domain-containing protein n=1 Tax=Xylona heveae (strain CBS 132557 / TC161) TaxID=1328760 RepID=A0A165G3F1_XYLHT|nr:hypothetical protein L228DRAFT_239646 [Xylona heveae TC161]KZF21693.1 hypothetical protein L228DRAFT_239646 [Xylona heveae TC161]